jgi:hypothetical protein
MFGNVLPIQKRRWNWLHVSKVKHKAVPDPKRFDTAFRMTTNDIALQVARTSRTETLLRKRDKYKNNENEPIICRSAFEDIKLRYAATLINGFIVEASTALPRNVRGTAPEKVKWSNCIHEHCSTPTRVLGLTLLSLSGNRPYARMS